MVFLAVSGPFEPLSEKIICHRVMDPFGVLYGVSNRP